MIHKTENCLYCGKKMESITAKKKFCSDLHRVYWNREQKGKVIVTDLTKPTNIIKPLEQLKTTFSIDTTKKHPLWKNGDPSIGTAAFYMRYDCMNYEELSKLKNEKETNH